MEISGLAVKQGLLKLFLVPGVTETLAALTDTQVTIFMFHRFAVPELGVVGHDPPMLRRNLAHLRKHHYDLISLPELFRRLREGEPLKQAVAFTIDDGYFEQARIAGPIFAEFGCPVTMFVTTGFLDGTTWFWWDKLTHIFERTTRTELRARLDNEEVLYRLDSAAARASASWDLSQRCQDALEADRLACVLDLSREADVELPASPPKRFAPLSWEEARDLEKSGMTFGPHTVTHPVLSSTSDEQAAFEITESWKRLNAEVNQPAPIFCYPAGRPRDFGEREMETIRRLGLWGAVSGWPGHIHPTVFRQSATAPYRVPRYGYEDSLPRVLQYLSGVERVTSKIRWVAT